MKAEIICVGTELLIGDVVNTNATYIAQKLSENGIFCYYHSVVGDNRQRLNEVLSLASQRSDLIIITGGLGPTYDDDTKETVAAYFGLELIEDKTSLAAIYTRLRRGNYEITPNNLKQALIPEGAHVFPNDNGTAPGIAIEHEDTRIILLPGPPFEMKGMFETYVEPYLQTLNKTVLVSDRIYLYGIGESKVESMLAHDMITMTNPTIAPYAKPNEVMLRITSVADTKTEAQTLNDPVVAKITAMFEPYVYGVNIASLEAALVRQLQQKKLRIATAESCTGGLLSERITRISGSSDVLDYSVVTYANSAKHTFLHVDPVVLETEGAVSEAVAKAMAEGIRNEANADIGVSTTGIAGPTGGSPEKPVGLVYIGIATKTATSVHKLDLQRHQDRLRIRDASASYALKAVLDILKKDY